MIKTAYMAHGCTPAILGEPLVEEAVGAQRCGPVMPSVHCSAKRCGEGRIAELLHSGAGTGDGGGAGRARGFARDHASPRQRNMLDGVLEAHGRLAGIELTNTTHVDAPHLAAALQEGRGRKADPERRDQGPLQGADRKPRRVTPRGPAPVATKSRGT